MSRIAVYALPLRQILIAANVLFALMYALLIAVVMSYAALHVEFAEEVRSTEAAVAKLEATYFASISELTATDYQTLGYTKPVAKTFVAGSLGTALR